jgi:hypothetical protein
MTHDLQDADALRRAFLAGRDVPCPACGYNLRNADVARCPECGGPLELAIATRRPRLGLYSAGVAAIALPLGFAVALGIPGWIGAIRDFRRADPYWGRADWTGLAIVTLLALGCAATIRAFVASAGWFLRRRPALQAVIVLTFLAAGIGATFGTAALLGAAYSQSPF